MRRAAVESSPYTRASIYERDRGICGICRKPAPDNYEIDHIVPIGLGGPDIPSNVQTACPSCNREKWMYLKGQVHLPV